MANKIQTEEQKRKFRVDRKAKEYMQTVQDFLAEKNGGAVSPE